MGSDSMADFYTVIRNGYLVKKGQVEVFYSKAKEAMAKILTKEGYLKSLKLKEAIPSEFQSSKFKTLVVELKYDEEGNPAIKKIQKVSKQGMRVYKNAKNLPRILSGLGLAIISTSKGLLTDKEARKRNLGGEIVCKVW